MKATFDKMMMTDTIGETAQMGDEEGALAFPTTGSGFAFMAPNTT